VRCVCVDPSNKGRGRVRAWAWAGFQKVCIIVRANYSPVGYTTTGGQPDVAAAWQDAEGQTVNENQELLDDWQSTDKKTFAWTRRRLPSSRPSSRS